MPSTPITRPELLAPAGGPESLRAALNNGADAVYLGVDRLNARRGAENFTIDSVRDACRVAHLKGARVYLTANVLVLPSEIPDALRVVADAWAAGVDAVIVQDLGLMRLIAQELPEVRVHASTQVNSHNSATIAELARLGVDRVTLARETSIDDMGRIASATDLEVESFVHGALCVSYSGQCLMSSVIGRRSANRGLCAQPCRLPYELLDDQGRELDTPGAYPLSPRDLAGVELLPRLIAAGVDALKIEGRMKSPEYVASVTRVYRAALDRAFDDPEGYAVTDAEQSILDEAFSRGFSGAYLDGIRDNRMMSYQRPNNRGVLVGRVARVGDGMAEVALESALDARDTIEVWTSRGRFAQTVGAMTLGAEEVMVGPSRSTVGVRLERAVGKGDRIFRVANAALDEAARRTFADDRGAKPVSVNVSVRLVLGEPVRVSLEHDGVVGSAEGPAVESARTKAIDVNDVMEHVGRLGSTPFLPDGWDIELQPGVGIGFSTLHAVRREAAEDLEARLLAQWEGRAPAEPSPPRRSARRIERDAPEIVVWTTDLTTARSCMAAGARRTIVPAWALADADDVPQGVVIELPRVVHERELPSALEQFGASDRVVVGNLGLLRDAAERAAVAEAHWSLNALNGWTTDVLSDAGATFCWLSPELSGRQIAEVAATAASPVGIAIYGRQELMVTEHCVLMALGECDRACGSCSRRESWYALRDRKGYGFPVTTDPTGRSHVHNSVPLDLTRAAREITEAGVDAVRIDITVEHSQQAQRITRFVREALEAGAAGRDEFEGIVESGTTGHFYRGVS